MKRFASPIAALFALTGCQPAVWNKPGASLSDFNADRFQIS
jgi:hypothetical protein